MSHPEPGPENGRKPQDRGFNMRSLAYAAIPLGFIAIVMVMMLGGEIVQETTDGIPADEIEEQIE